MGANSDLPFLGAIRSSCCSSETFFGLRVAVCMGQIALKRDSAYFLVFCRFGVKFHPDLLGAETAVYPALT